MNAKTFDKTMLPSRDVTEGPLRAARRSHLSRQTLASATARFALRSGDVFALVSGGRFSRATGESLIGQDGPETGVGDAIGLIQDGDIISIEAVKRTLDRDVSGVEELVARVNVGKAPSKTCGALHNDASQRDWARKGAVIHAGGKQKWFAMRTFDRTLCGIIAAFALWLGGLSAVAAPTVYRSPQDALEQGIGAYNGGYYEIAIPALKYASDAHLFLAPYYLARIYADNNSSHTDHAKAFELYKKIAAEHTDVDPDDFQRAPYVAKAMTQIAGYLLTGLPEVGLKPNARIAVEYLREAAQFFRDEDAQFELAKLYLRGEGTQADVPYAKHWLSVLSQKGHAGAQAFLADLLWRGKYMEANPVRALALISVAVANAPPYERVWIEDIYQNIYCGTGQGIRKQATGLVADWRTRYGRKPDVQEHSGLRELSAHASRACSNGDRVPFEMFAAKPQERESAGAAAASASAEPARLSGDPQLVVKGSATGPSLRDVGATLSGSPQK